MDTLKVCHLSQLKGCNLAMVGSSYFYSVIIKHPVVTNSNIIFQGNVFSILALGVDKQIYFNSSGGCLVGVWKVSGGCLEGVWRVSGRCMGGV